MCIAEADGSDCIPEFKQGSTSKSLYLELNIHSFSWDCTRINTLAQVLTTPLHSRECSALKMLSSGLEYLNGK